MPSDQYYDCHSDKAESSKHQTNHHGTHPDEWLTIDVCFCEAVEGEGGRWKGIGKEGGGRGSGGSAAPVLLMSVGDFLSFLIFV